MELSSFSENIVVKRMRRGSQSVELHINIDAIVPDYYEVLDRDLIPVSQRLEELQVEIDAQSKTEVDQESKSKPKTKPKRRSLIAIEKEIAELHRETWAARLTTAVKLPDGRETSLLVGWDVTEQNVPVSPTKEVLLRLPPNVVMAIGEFCMHHVNTVKKTGDEEEMSEVTPDGSPALRVVGQST